MKEVLVHPCYFGPISQFVLMAEAGRVLFENEDNFQKQTYRNRMYIYGANGRLSLTIPIKHSKGKDQHQKSRDVQIENDFSWQQQHWRSLQNCYRTSPYFEFYEDDFYPLYHTKYENLMDFNHDCINLALESLQLELDSGKTSEFISDPGSARDARFLVNAKPKREYIHQPYNQVFEDKFGHLGNLSIVDLIFNQGPNALNFLEQQELPL